jgi:putative oxygen-independent coproporphyrinogen III oxidase
VTDAVSRAGEGTTSAGLYVHIPFCLTRCGYCDFNTYAGLDALKPGYLAALEDEASLCAPDWVGVPFTSVFLGGGTPTTLDPDDLGALLARLRRSFAIDDRAEVTIEANPDTVDETSLSALRATGFSRLSMGAQSFDVGVLASLERLHGPEAVRLAFAAARGAGYDDINLDLIYGAQGESADSWRATLEETIALAPEHVSAYALTVEPGTMLGRQVTAGERPAPDGDTQADRYDVACELLAAAGYRHYEVSNWAKPGRECRHNLGYWERRPYLGLGAGAHSFRDGRRWWNVRPPEQYLSTVAAGERPVGGAETLGPEEERLERVFLGLRAPAVGVPAAGLEVAAYLEDGLLAEREGRLTATDRGMFLANDLALNLVAQAGG